MTHSVKNVYTYYYCNTMSTARFVATVSTMWLKPSSTDAFPGFYSNMGWELKTDVFQEQKQWAPTL